MSDQITVSIAQIGDFRIIRCTDCNGVSVGSWEIPNDPLRLRHLEERIMLHVTDRILQLEQQVLGLQKTIAELDSIDTCDSDGPHQIEYARGEDN